MSFGEIRRLPAAGLALAACLSAAAQDSGGAATQANNPLANFTAFNLQNYYIGKLTGTDDYLVAAYLNDVGIPRRVIIAERQALQASPDQ